MPKEPNHSPKKRRRPLTEEEKRRRAAVHKRRLADQEKQHPTAKHSHRADNHRSQTHPDDRAEHAKRDKGKRKPIVMSPSDADATPKQHAKKVKRHEELQERSQPASAHNEFEYQPQYEESQQPSHDNNKPQKKKRSWVKWLLLSIFVVLLVLGGLFTFVIATGGFGEQKEVEVMIPEGATQTDVAQILEDEDVVFNGTLFKAYLRVTGGGDNIRSGRYQFRTSSGFPDVKQQLSEGYSGDEVVGKVTVPEGSNVEDIAGILAEQFNVSKEQMLELINDDALIAHLSEAYPKLMEGVAGDDDVRYKLEGYLFPSTYSLTEKDTPESTIEMMVAAMEQIRQKYEGYIAQSDLSLHQILTLASLIEAEAGKGEDRRLISGVFMNRLAEDMPIQSDITVNYANRTHATYVTIDDTQTDSPYNLYQNTGLGPGPFDSPSEESIEAALKPEKSDYLYFVADLETGQVYYSKTYDEHMSKVDKYVSEEDATLNQEAKPAE
ncbi:MAG: endolytic transglycosylase MltG [Aerococcus sp.]|nr:endolytic transglycosylase MltG [Aerococcus sp.]